MKPKTQKKNTAQKTKIPDGWEVKKLGEVCEIFNGSTPLKSNKSYWIDGEINWFTIKDIRKQGRRIVNTEQKITQKGLKESSLVILPPKSVLLCCTASVGEYAITEIELTTNQQFNGLVIKDDKKIYPEFLFYFSSTLKEILLRQSGKTTIDFVSMKKLKQIKISYPKSLDEQKRIVKILDEVFAKVDRAKEIAEENLKNAQELFESYLQNIFEKKGDDWEEKKLGEIGKVSMCKRILKKQTSESGDVPFYKIGTFGKEANAFISNDIYIKYKNKYSFPEKGDILISASGTIGRTVVYDGKPAYFQDSNIVWLSHDKSEVLNEYLKYFYSVCDWGATRGATISRLYNDNLRQIKIPYPKSLDEQKQIVKKLDELQEKTKRLEAILRSKIAELEKLKKSVLEKAFRGEL